MENDLIVENILKERYYQPGETCWKDIVKRVINAIYPEECKDKDIFEDFLLTRRFLPNSPTLMNAGTQINNLSACFCLAINDDMNSIFDTLKRAALIFKSGGGVGINFSYLRPEGAKIGSTLGTSTGVLGFIEVFNTMIETVKSAGVRRGAAISILSIRHPDVEKFIEYKNTEGKLSNFNISILVDNEFMEAVEYNRPWDLIFDNKVYKTVKARDLYDKIAQSMWTRAEPGILFYDAINRDNILESVYGPIDSCNPCVTGDARILTKEYGDIAIADVVGEKVTIWNGFGWSSNVIPQVTGIDQEVMYISVMIEKEWEGEKSISFKNITCTPYHKFIMLDGSRKCASELTTSDCLQPWEFPYAKSNITHVCIENISTERRISHKVYCLTEPNNHSFMANGIMVGNCGEKMLVTDHETGGGSSCNLGSFNLSMYVIDGKFNYLSFLKDVRSSVRILDRIIDVNTYPIPEIEKISKDVRELGIGIMGYHDALIKMGMIYGSKESIEFTHDLFLKMKNHAILESENLVKTKGTFPAYNKLKNKDKIVPRRNSFLISLAPTGTLSLLSDCSSGIEPNFSYVYNRSTWVDGEKKTYRIVKPYFREAIFQIYNELNGNKLLQWMLDNGTIQNCPFADETLKKLFVTAKDVSWKDHIDVQAASQKHVDSSISKTINCSNSTTEKDVSELIKYAWKSGCKGLTIYREGSRDDVVLETNATKKQNNIVELTNPVQYKLVTANGRILPKTPRVMPATQYKVSTGCGHMLVSIGEVNGKPHSITIINKGGCDASTQAMAELIALVFRVGWPLWDLTKILCNIKCQAAMKNPKSDGPSCAAIIGKIIKDNYPCEDEPAKIDNITVVNEKLNETVTINPNKCPECGGKLDHTEGCVKCTSCSYSKCG